jgi:hypothetical protein
VLENADLNSVWAFLAMALGHDIMVYSVGTEVQSHKQALQPGHTPLLRYLLTGRSMIEQGSLRLLEKLHLI